jgi:hypothetical protein
MTLHTHRHTFVFLLPAWTAAVAALGHDPQRQRMTMFALVFAVIYVFAGLPAVAVPIDRLFGTRWVSSKLFDDPIWANLALIGALSAYAVLRMRDSHAILARDSPSTGDCTGEKIARIQGPVTNV